MFENFDLTKSIYKEVKEMILDKKLKPGEKIIQEKIAEKLGVSRTPLQRALMILENEYLVVSIPRKGVYVRELDLKEMINIYDCREAIEGMAARTLASISNENIVSQLKQCFLPYLNADTIDVEAYTASDEEFHKKLVKLTQNEPLDKIYFFSSIHDKVTNIGLVRTPEETLDEHMEIIRAIELGDADTAEKHARQHINKSRTLLFNQYKQNLKNKLSV